ncbi:unnamed protein product [Rhizoctonia solani]|uniref:Uncharacterized protein n=1 Tax=Rhizoctonia solani TaxID=456999 RepID=A0A8H3HNN2_9AGAM|nr:unnamed protein product [Rhizoctonia solani]
MSQTHTPTSDVSTSSGSQSSCRRLDSNTTPSPSGGNKSPMLNPRALSNRLAMLEASQALSQASATLSIAAKAMSRAAASLAEVCDYGDEDYVFEDGGSGKVKDWVDSPDWTQSSYNLAPIPATIDEKSYAVNLDEGYKLAKVEEIPPIEAAYEFPQPERPSESEPSATLHYSGPAPVIEVSPPAPEEIIIQASAEASSSRYILNLPTDTASPATETSPPAVPVNKKKKVDLSLWDYTTTDTGGQVELEAQPSKNIYTAPVSAPVPAPVTGKTHVSAKAGQGSSSSNTPQPTKAKTGSGPSQAIPADIQRPKGPTHIILERGFDSLPALCHIAERCAKTVCIYNYPGTVMTTANIATMLKNNTKRPVMIPENAKQDRLAAATNKFNSAPSGILVWASSKKLLKIKGLADSPDIQLVHIGEPSELNADITCPKTTTILAKSNLKQTPNSTSGDYVLDVSNAICNKQGLKSPLQPFREWLRSHLSLDTNARAIYWDWILQRRKQDPNPDAVKIVRLANQFAEEFLLRGRSTKSGDPVGGQVTIAESALKGLKMGPAVQAKVLLVA